MTGRRKPDGKAIGEEEKLEGGFGTRKEGRKFFAGGKHAKGARISGT